jgi:hypothetical protein
MVAVFQILLSEGYMLTGRPFFTIACSHVSKGYRRRWYFSLSDFQEPTNTAVSSSGQLNNKFSSWQNRTCRAPGTIHAAALRR